MDNDIITFIIVTWNNEDCIINCLDSIYKFTSNFKVIIVDNNSTDSTVSIVKEKKYNNCIIIDSKENNGFALGNNIALDFVKTKYICYLNPDTILIEDVVTPSLELLNNNKEIGVVGCKLLNKDLSLQASTFNYISPFNIYAENLRFGLFLPNFLREKFFPYTSKCKKSKFVDWIIGAEMIMLTEDAKKIKGFSTEYFMYTEDMDLCMKMKRILNKKIYYNSSFSLIHIGGVSESKNVNYSKVKKLIKNDAMFAIKFYDRKKAKKIINAFIKTYKIRYFFVKLFYYGKKRKNIVDKMKNGIELSKEVRKEMF